MTSIGNAAFESDSGLTNITIPSSVTSIGDRAFSYCSGLTNITIGNSVTYIDDNTFSDCSRLHSVTIGAGVLSIGKKAFPYDPVKVIWLCNTPPEGFQNCNGMVNYVSNESYSGLSNMTVYPYLSSMFETGGIKYIPTSPSERTCVAIDCAYNETASDIRLNRTVSYKGIEMTLTDVRPYLCYGNEFVKSLVMDGYVGDIGYSAFEGCRT